MDQATAVHLLARLGVHPADLLRVKSTPFPQSAAILNDLKARVRSNWKKLAFELHPDRTGNNSEKTAEFQALTRLRDDFERLTVSATPPPRPAGFTVGFVRAVKVHGPVSYSTNPFEQPSRAINAHYIVTMRPL